MEKEGLIRAISHIKKRKFKIEILLTDRRKQIAKCARERFPSTKHYYDIWHLAKYMYDISWFVIFQYSCISPPPPISTLTHFTSPATHARTHTHTTALRKKLDAATKEKDFELVGEWKKSVINHIYWSAVSTSN